MGLLLKKTPLQLWNENKEAFLKIYSEENRKPLTHSQLVKRFVDSNGKQLYGFGKDIALPLERFGKVKEYLQYMAKGLTSQEDEQMDDSLANVIMSDMKDTDKKIKCGAIFDEKRKRRRMSIHTELFYNYIAVQLVYEDENPEIFDNDFQLKKVAQFKEEVKKGGAYFFFQQPELKKLNDLLRLSQQDWEKSWDESLIQQQVLSQILKVYESAII